MAKVRITKRAAIARASAGIQLTAATNGTNGNHQFNSNNIPGTLRFSEPPIKVGGTLQPVDRADANLEAENGETAVLSLGGLPAQFKIGGKRHSQGGTPLNLPDDSFIFSDTAKMKITDLSIQAQFGMVPKKSGYTPAAIAKKYDINKFRKVLADPNSEDIDRKTAEASIANCNIKLGKLALVQESMKGFPQGIPAIAMPYILANNIDPKSYLPTEGQAEQPDADMGVARYGGNMVSQFNTVDSTPLLKAQTGLTKNKQTDVINKYDKENLSQWENISNKNDQNKSYWERVKQNNVIQRENSKSIDPRMTEALEKIIPFYGKDAEGFGDWIKTLSLMPQNEINHLLTGYYENPYTTYRRYNEEPKSAIVKGLMKYGTDPLIVDLPYTLLQKGLAKSLPYGAKLAKYTANKTKDAAVYASKKATELYNKLSPELKAKIADKGLKGIQKIGQIAAHDESENTPTNVNYPIPEIKKVKPAPSPVKPKPKTVTAPLKPTIYPAQNEAQLQDSIRIAEANKQGLYNQNPNYQRDPKTGHLVKQGVIQPYFRNEVPQGTYMPEVPQYLLDKLQKKAYGGNMDLPKAQFGNNPLEEDPSLLVGKPKTKKAAVVKASAYDTNPEYIAETARIAALKPDNTVSQEDYDKLQALAAKMNNQDFGQETEDFQQAFHDIAPLVAANIIAKHPTGKTALARKMGYSQFDIRGNKDKYNGPRTQQYLAALQALKPKATAKTPEKKAEEATKDAFERNPPKGFTYNNANAPWWLQDIISTAGAVGDKASIVNQRPWQATPDFSLIENVKYDPTRELAANAEQANIANQAAMYFTDPRQLAAQQAATQGLAGKNAADIMGRYNSLNVGLANQTNAQNTAIKNQASATKAGLATSLYDKNIAANDNFNIARKQATQNIRNSYINAITNRANTANLNTMNPNYAVNPTTGMTYFRPSGEFLATNAAGNKYAEAVRLAKEMAPGDPALQAQVLKDILSNGQDQNNTGYPSRYAIPGYQGQNG